MITSLQIRIARAILRWTVDDLSKKTNIPWARIQFLEKIENFEKSHLDKVDIIQKTFEGEKLVFIDKTDNLSESVAKKNE